MRQFFSETINVNGNSKGHATRISKAEQSNHRPNVKDDGSTSGIAIRMLLFFAFSVESEIRDEVLCVRLEVCFKSYDTYLPAVNIDVMWPELYKKLE